MSEVSADDRDLAIRTMLGEEGSDAGQAGVAAVILNRLAAGSYGGSVGDVVLAPNQFEAWTRQSDQLLGVRRDDPRYVAAGQLFDAVRDGSLPDPTNGATHFYAPVAQAALGRQAPGWAQGRGLKLGSSMFYAPQGRVERKPEEPGFKVDPSKIADKSPSQTAAKFPSDQLPPGATLFQPSSSKAVLKAAEFPSDQLPPGATLFKPDAQKPTPGFVEKGIGALERVATDPDPLSREKVGEQIDAVYGAGRENVEQGIARMKSGNIAGGAFQDVAGTLQEVASVPTGWGMALLGLGQYGDPMMAGTEAPHIASAGDAAKYARTGAEGRAAVEAPAPGAASPTLRPSAGEVPPAPPPSPPRAGIEPREFPRDQLPPGAEPVKPPAEVRPAPRLVLRETLPPAEFGGTVLPESHNFSIVDEKGDTIGDVAISPRKETKTLVVDWVGDPEGKEQLNLGPAAARGMLRQLAEQYPEYDWVQGFRTGGARTKSGEGSTWTPRIRLRPESGEPRALSPDQLPPGAEPAKPSATGGEAPVTIQFRGKNYSGVTKIEAVSAAQRATGISMDRIWDEATPESSRQEPGDLGAAGAPPGPSLPDRPTREMVWEQEDHFNRLAKAPWADKSELLNLIDSWPERVKTAAVQERLYRHMEDPSFPLTAQERADYEQYIAPLKREELALWEEARKTDFEGIEDFDPAYAHRMVKERNPQFDRPLGIGGGDEGPLGGQGRLPMSTSSMEGRVFFAIQDVATGERKIVARDKDGNMRIIEPGRPAHPIGGADIKIRDAFRDRNGRAWTLEQARTDEIEAATGREYYKNAGANTIDNIVRLRQVVRAIHEVERLKASPEWAAYARKIGERGTPRGWRVPKMPLFHGWRVHPRLADVIDDFYGHEPGSITENLAKINRWTVGTMFWSPVTHIANVGTHWFTARGWDNVTPHGMLSLAVDGARAFREVAGRGKKYQELLRDGNGLLYASTSLQKFSEMMLKRLGEDVVRNPARWDPIARTLGVGPSDLVRMIYEGSSRILWSVSDMFMMQRVLELERKGMSTRDAIEEAERHIPNYRAHSEILGKRIAAQVYFHPLVTQFSRYHYGQLNSWANIAKDAIGGGKDALGRDRRLQALGNVMATGVMMVFIAPLVNEELKKTFGSKVRLPARGSTTLAGPIVDAAMQAQWAKKVFPKYVRDYYNDDSNLLMTAQNLFAIAPITRAFGEFATNLDWFSGRRVAEPAEASDALHSAAKGQLKQAAGHAARFGLQEAEHAGERIVQPLSALSRILQGDKGLVKGLVEQGLGLTEPNTAGIAAARRREESEAGYRRRHPRGPLEELGGRLPF